MKGNIQMNAFTKIVQPTMTAVPVQSGRVIVPVFCKIDFDGSRLSITGVEGPRRDGDAYGGCGQLTLDPDCAVAGWTPALVTRFAQIWQRWNHNDMRAGCEHQRAAGWGKEVLEVVAYTMTTEGVQMRQKAAERVAVSAARSDEPPSMTDQERLLLCNEEWYKPIHVLPAEPVIAELYREKSRETKPAGGVYPHEHPQGVLTKSCPTCGYKFGSAWLLEEVPTDVLEFLQGLPEAPIKPAWV